VNLLVRAVPPLADVPLEAEQVAQVDSKDMSHEVWRALALRCAHHLARPDVDGIVITHGTDTLEETAWLLDLVLTSDKPVVLLGAMRTASDEGWDGPANLQAALRVAASPQARGRGALVTLGGLVLAAADARKLHSAKPDAFGAPGTGPVAVVEQERVRFLRPPSPRPAWRGAGADAGLRVAQIEPRVDLVSASAGADDRFIRCAIDSGARGLVVEAFGAGNVTPGLRAGIAAAIGAGIPVLVASRCVEGGVSDRYGFEGGGRDLVTLGAVLAGTLSAAKARVLLMVALGAGGDVGAIVSACGTAATASGH
jgi:L-asparaginase